MMLSLVETIFGWYFDEEEVFPKPTKPYIVKLLRLFVLYPIVLFLSAIFLLFVLLYRIFNTYILKRDVSELMNNISWVMIHVTMKPNL